jgi:hypothetical protein
MLFPSNSFMAFARSFTTLEVNRARTSTRFEFRKLRFVLVPMRLAAQAWPQPGLAEPQSASMAETRFFFGQQHRKWKRT